MNKKLVSLMVAIALFITALPAMAQWGIISVSSTGNCEFDIFVDHDPNTSYEMTDGNITRSATQHMDANTHWVVSYADMGATVSIKVNAKNNGGKLLGEDELLNQKNDCFTPAPNPDPTPEPKPVNTKANFQTGNGTFHCEFENLWNLPNGWVGEQWGNNVLNVKNGTVHMDAVVATGNWTTGIHEFQFGNHEIGKFQITVSTGLGGLLSGISCEAVQPEKVDQGRCVDCGPAACLLDQGKFIWNPATQRYLGIVNNKPVWFKHASEAIAEGLTYSGSECSNCVNKLVNAETIWFGPGSTINDTANALALFLGDSSPTAIEVQMATKVAKEWAKTKPQDGDWYNYQKLFSDAK